MAGLAVWVVATPDDDAQPYLVPVPAATSAAIDPAGAAQALQRLVTAISDRDRDAAVSLAAPDDAQTGARLRDLVDVAEAAVLSDVTLRYIDADGGLAADGSWAAAVAATWAYSGFDAQPAATEISVRFGSSPDGVVIAGVGGGNSRTPVWMSGPMQVSRSSDLLVVAAVGTDVDAYVRLAEAAAPTVASVVTGWRPQLVVEVPTNGAALESALGAEPGYYAQIAAVTGAGGNLSPGAPVHIFINTDVTSTLGRAGRQVVLAHEATHIATDAPFSEAPTWLTEGFADYVALRDAGLPLSTTAAQIAAQVRTSGLPRSLPSAADFSTRGPDLGAVYEASWLACVALARGTAPVTVAEFYRRVSDGTPLRRAVMDVLGLTEGRLVARWRNVLRNLAGAGA